MHFTGEHRATRQCQRIKDSKPQDINEKQKCPGDIPKWRAQIKYQSETILFLADAHNQSASFV